MSNHKDKKIGSEIYGPGKTFFDDVAMDNLMEAFLELTAAVWTYRDRSIVLEQVLQDIVGKEKGIDISELVEQYQPSEENKTQRKQEREKLINDVFHAFVRRPK